MDITALEWHSDCGGTRTSPAGCIRHGLWWTWWWCAASGMAGVCSVQQKLSIKSPDSQIHNSRTQPIQFESCTMYTALTTSRCQYRCALAHYNKRRVSSLQSCISSQLRYQRNRKSAKLSSTRMYCSRSRISEHGSAREPCLAKTFVSG